MKKISVIFGTRPEAIKLAPVILQLRRTPGVITEVCVTAQHRQMLDQVLQVFKIKPDVDLNLMEKNQNLGQFTARALLALEGYFESHQPDLVLVQGDTTTVLSASLSAFYHHVPVGHVEAGLRTGNLQAPWPEEANRILTSQLARLHFAPTETSRQNLLREGIRDDHIFITGNPVIDALYLVLAQVRETKPIVPGLPSSLQPYEKDRPKTILITGHRRENFGAGFEEICRAIVVLAQNFPKVQFIYPVHLNPNVRDPVWRVLRPEMNPNIHLIEPLSYLNFVAMMDNSILILTDSGGIQEEAPSLGKPLLVMRDVTERPEALASGCVRLVGPHADCIISEVSRLLTDSNAYGEMVQTYNPYGDGHAAEYIVKIAMNYLNNARCKDK
ncbi:MAG TPA: UDP-N-acetylglucosamine 2-epimerase (non-hydrolyzing) [Kiritimatiellia bacterium]|nr:UDP-N-acetylglucosamine 2-epimerase (non-hydrolyzing) [Kiritimatiellia bacterium]